MSTDYHLVCVPCQKWIETVASSSIAYGEKLWRDTQALDKLRDFLFEHIGHELVFNHGDRLEEYPFYRPKGIDDEQE
mgnify:CR=1 FL=1